MKDASASLRSATGESDDEDMFVVICNDDVTSSREFPDPKIQSNLLISITSNNASLKLSTKSVS